ncbi:hypothetical protein OIO90_005195 [Microbotryomycetes sp. JL221]|nr:hypothetical protein OIO90_005195 [Microbotryomycetes sp. JL221]
MATYTTEQPRAQTSPRINVAPVAEDELEGGFDPIDGNGQTKLATWTSIKRKATTRGGWFGKYDYATLCMPQLPCAVRGTKRRTRGDLFFGINDDLPISLAIICGLQHALAMLAGVITPPIIFGSSLALPPSTRNQLVAASLMVSGICSALQMTRFPIPFTKKKYWFGTGMLTVVGTSFATLSTASSIFNAMYADGTCPSTVIDGTVVRQACPQAYGYLLGTSALCSLTTMLLSFLPPGAMKKIFPPIVTGTVVLLLGASLVGKSGALNWMGGTNCHARPETGLYSLCPTVNGPHALPWGSAEYFGLVAAPLGYASSATIKSAPAITFLWVETFKMKIYGPAILPFICVYITLAAEAAGDITGSAEASRQPVTGRLYESRIQGGILADGINGLLSALMQNAPVSLFGQNVGCITVTRCGNKAAGYWCAAFLIVFGILAKISGVFLAIPNSVLGGVTTFLFASVATSGLKILSFSKFTRRDRMILASALGLGLANLMVSDWSSYIFTYNGSNSSLKGFYNALIIVLSTPFLIGALVAALLNTLLPRDPEDEPIESRGHEHDERMQQVELGKSRSSSVSSAQPNGSTVRRSSRASLTPSEVAVKSTLSSAKKPTTKAAPKTNGRKRAASVVEEESEEDDDEDDNKSRTSRKRKSPRASTSGTPRKKQATAVKPLPKPKPAPKIGLNPIADRFEPFPLPSQFNFDIAAFEPVEQAPKTAFVFGNGDFGQHGMGFDPDSDDEDDNQPKRQKVLVEISRPRLHVLFEEMIGKKQSGWEQGIASLECGGMHSLVLDKNGRVWSWGINDNAALGRVTAVKGVDPETLETKPMQVEGLPEDFKAVRIAAGDSVSLAISDRGELRCWGSFRNSEGLLGFDGSKGSSLHQIKPVTLKNLENQVVVQLATGSDHFVALTTDGKVFACGNGEQCQLGRKIIQRHRAHGLTPERLALKNIVLVGSGVYHSFAVDKDGQVFAWGLNSFHQTGVAEDDGGWEETITTPTIVESLLPKHHNGAKVVQIAGGEHHTVFLLSNGQVWACGRCDGSEIGLGKDHEQMKAMKEREQEALIRRKAKEEQERQRLRDEPPQEDDEGNPGQPLSDFELELKAKENAAQLVPLPNPFIPEPTQIKFPSEADGSDTRIIQIATGTRQNFGVSSKGTLFAWGFGNTCQLGLGPDEEEAETPTQVKSKAMGGFRVISAHAGGQNSIVLAQRGPDALPSLYKDEPAQDGKEEVDGNRAEDEQKQEQENVQVNGAEPST